MKTTDPLDTLLPHLELLEKTIELLRSFKDVNNGARKNELILLGVRAIETQVRALMVLAAAETEAK